jgi:hypothetical protein
LTTAKPKILITNPKRFFYFNKENQELQQRIFETFDVWTTERLIDEVYLSLIDVKAQMCLINSKKDSGSIRRIYQEQARYKMYRMVVFRPPPTFIIYLKDLDERVRRELAKEDKTTRNDILKQVAERILEQVNSRYFLLSAKPFLKVRLEK